MVERKRCFDVNRIKALLKMNKTIFYSKDGTRLVGLWHWPQKKIEKTASETLNYKSFLKHRSLQLYAEL